jgi:hypothetical protein
MKRREDALATSVAPIPLCVFVPLCEILFAYIRVHSRLLFLRSFVPFRGYSSLCLCAFA